MELDYEKQRKKALDDFLMRKRTKGFTGDIQALIKQGNNQDAEQLKQDLCILKRQRRGLKSVKVRGDQRTLNQD